MNIFYLDKNFQVNAKLHCDKHVVKMIVEYAHEVEILGASKIIYSPDKPLSCGARVWIETDEEVLCL